MLAFPKPSEDRGTWAYDIETLSNYILLVFRNRDTGEIQRFDFGTWMLNKELSAMRDSLANFIAGEVKYIIGFNNLNFDDIVTTHILKKASLVDPVEIYNFSQKTIEKEFSSSRSALAEIPWVFKSLDLYRIWHFDNKARATSLKWLQCHLNMPLIEEMPFDHTSVVSKEQAEDVYRYCLNDVNTTLEFFEHPKTQSLIEMRKGISNSPRKYTFDPTNLSNSAIGEKIFLSEMPSITSKSTPGHWLNLGSIVLKKASTFETPEFRGALNTIAIEKVNVYKPDKFKYAVPFRGLAYEFGLGGLHAVGAPSMFIGKILSIDVESYYPNISILNGLHPTHLGMEFVETYEKLFKERQSHPKGTVINLALKEALNSVFGKSNSQHSDLFDPSFTYGITINGQLMLARLCEMIGENASAGRVIMVNTDGIEVHVDTPTEERYTKQMVEEWCNEFGFKVTINQYMKIMIRDVNNYIAMYDDGTIKAKGAYEINKDFNKDPSGQIIASAVTRAFKNFPAGTALTSIKDEIKQEVHLKPFQMHMRAKTGKIYGRTADGAYTWELPKTIRYIVSNKGYVLYKKTDKKEERVHPGQFVIILNDMNKALEENTEQELSECVNVRWYIAEAMKLWMEPPPSLF